MKSYVAPLLLTLVVCADLVLVDALAKTTTTIATPNPNTTGSSDGKIVGGIAVTIDAFKYQLSLMTNGGHFCGASIISISWALTAAHCLIYPMSSLTLRAGSADRTKGGTIHSVIQMIRHEYYNSVTFDLDIGLLKVNPTFVFTTTVQSIPMPSSSVVLGAGINSTVSGWGTMNPGATTLPTILRAVSVPVVSITSCRTSYGTSAITTNMVCAGFGTGGKDSCQGDSGGPLVAMIGGTKLLIGIVSWGKSCALPGYPGVYTQIPALRKWIFYYSGV